MKKIYLLIALLTMTATANAQVLGEEKMFLGDGDLRYIPKQFTYDGEPLLLLVDEDRWIVSVYNGDIEKVREFEGPKYEYVSESQELNTETNEWVTTSKYSASYSAIARVCPMDADDNPYPCHDDEVYLTQTLFNMDEKIEYISIDYEKSISDYDYDNDGVIDHRTIRRGEKCAGFSIVQEDGTVLQSVKGDYGDYFMLVKIDGKVYLVAGTEYEDGDKYTVFFLIDRNSSSVKQVKSLPGIRVRPSVADRNEQVTVELEDDAREIQVVNAAGQTLKRIPVGEGQREVNFSTRGLNSGVNVVRANGRNRQTSRKFIVK